MGAPQNTIALIFDFDDTLTDESTSKLLENYGIDPIEFWQTQNKKLIMEQGWDPIPAYLKLILDNVGEQKPFGLLKNSDLREFGSRLEMYPGIPDLFDDMVSLTQNHPASHPSIEFYVISSGLEEIIRGSVIANYLSGIWGCNFAENAEGTIAFAKNIVSFTEKTRFIFEINKGLPNARDKPYAVNEEVREEDRRIPLRNMIYVGDGLTDVPCFSLLGRFQGQGFGVFDSKKEGSAKKGLEKLIAPRRVMSLNSPRYGPDDDLGSLLRAAVTQVCLRMDAETQTAIRHR